MLAGRCAEFDLIFVEEILDSVGEAPGTAAA